RMPASFELRIITRHDLTQAFLWLDREKQFPVEQRLLPGLLSRRLFKARRPTSHPVGSQMVGEPRVHLVEQFPPRCRPPRQLSNPARQFALLARERPVSQPPPLLQKRPQIHPPLAARRGEIECRGRHAKSRRRLDAEEP